MKSRRCELHMATAQKTRPTVFVRQLSPACPSVSPTGCEAPTSSSRTDCKAEDHPGPDGIHRQHCGHLWTITPPTSDLARPKYRGTRWHVWQCSVANALTRRPDVLRKRRNAKEARRRQCVERKQDAMRGKACRRRWELWELRCCRTRERRTYVEASLCPP